MTHTKRFAVALLALAAFGTSAIALAETPADRQCHGHEGKNHGRKDHDGKGPQGHFKKGDKNGDGFLTKDEVGDKRWSRIQVADANKDNKVSQAELQQARKDGKLRGPHPKA